MLWTFISGFLCYHMSKISWLDSEILSNEKEHINISLFTDFFSLEKSQSGATILVTLVKGLSVCRHLVLVFTQKKFEHVFEATCLKFLLSKLTRRKRNFKLFTVGANFQVQTIKDDGGQNSTEVAFALLTQQPGVRFLAFLRIFPNNSGCCWV